MLKTAAGLLRIMAVLVPVITIVETAAVATILRTFGLPIGFMGPVTILVALFMVGYGAVWWGIADALILVADTYDVQAETRAEVARLAASRGA